MKKYIKCDNNLDVDELEEYIKEVKKAMRKADKDVDTAKPNEYMNQEQAESYYMGKSYGLSLSLEILSKFTGQWYLS